MFDRYLGITKQAFLGNKVVPANDNDQHNDNKCTFCWDSYHDDHPPVRVLPCNHVFGRDCLVTMTDAPGGDRCPICRASLFRPPATAVLKAFIGSALYGLFLLVVSTYHRLLVLQHDLQVYQNALLVKAGRPGKVATSLVWFWCYSNNVFCYRNLLVSNVTNLQDRNPQLNVRNLMEEYWRYSTYYHLLRYIFKSYLPASPGWLRIVLATSFVVITNWSKITNYKDRFIFVVLVMASLIMGYLLAVISPSGSFGF